MIDKIFILVLSIINLIMLIATYANRKRLTILKKMIEENDKRYRVNFDEIANTVIQQGNYFNGVLNKINAKKASTKKTKKTTTEEKVNNEEINKNKFNNKYNNELININDHNIYVNKSDAHTPFYNNIGVKVVSITKECSKISFYYKTYTYNNNYNAIYLYIDGKYYGRYCSTVSDIWASIEITDITTGKHEFTWVLYSYDSNNYYSCIDNICFDGILETNKNDFKYNSTLPIADIPTDSRYYNTNDNPFYNNKRGIKVVSITKECSKLKFYYKTDNEYNYTNAIYLYIDGKYYGKFINSDMWTSVEIENITHGKHEFTWVLYSYNDDNYSCIDTISFDGIIETAKKLNDTK